MADSRPWPSSSVLGYALALAAAAAAVALRWLLEPWLDGGLALVTLPAAVAAAVWFGGYRPAIVAALAGYAGCHFLFLRPADRLGVDAVVGFVAYLVSCCLLIGFGEAMRAARARTAASREFLRITLASIGDAVITTDVRLRVTQMNAMAESLTGWPQAEAAGQPLDAVFRIVNEATRQAVENPAARALQQGAIMELANHTVLVARNGSERPIDDSAAPIRDEWSRIVGSVLVFRDITERRRSEIALQRSERQLDDFFENAAVALHWVGPDGTILRANRAELDLLGYGVEEYVGRHIADFHVDRPVIEDILARLLRGEEIRDEPARLRCKDGSLKDVLITSSGLFEDGEFVHSRCFTVDVTERKRAEETRARLAAIVSASGDAIVSKTLDGMIRSWNAGAERIFGYSADEAVGQPIDLIIPPELRDEERSILERLRRGEHVDPFETTRLAKDGRRLAISLTASPVRDESGRIIGTSKVARDVTERRRAEAMLRETEKRFRALADSAPVLMWLNDASGCVFVNRAYLEFLGLEEQTDVRGYDWTRYVHPEDRESYVSSYVEASTRRAPFSAEFRFRRHDGEYRWMHSVGVPRFSGEAGLLGYTGCTYDVHDARVAAAALQEADRRKDEFLAMLAHELRNPLAPIQSSVELLELAEGDRDLLRQARETIERQVGHLVRLVDDLLDVARITRDRLELRRTRVELASVVHQAVEACRPLAREAGQRIEVGLPEEPVYLDADDVRLAQVFGNLLNNACKHARRGGTVGISAELQGSEIVVSVVDDGAGIPEGKLETIFEMFAQIDPTGDRSNGGLGIGLTLAKRLVELHGGSIRAKSEGPGLGSELVVRLPVLVGGLADAPSASAPQPPADARPRVPRRVLVVDDNGDSARALAKLLELAGHATATAADGLEALDVAERFRPDVALLDIGLPEMDGFEVCRRLRAKPWAEHVVVVALTGWGQAEDRRRSRKAGFDGHLVKPIDSAGLVQLLDSLRPRGDEAEGGPPAAGGPPTRASGA